MNMIHDEIEQTKADLAAAIEFLKTHDWGQGSDYSNGAYCAFGAIRAAVGGLEVQGNIIINHDWVQGFALGSPERQNAWALVHRSANVARAFYRVKGIEITTYNDDFARSKGQVIEALQYVLDTITGEPSRA